VDFIRISCLICHPALYFCLDLFTNPSLLT
jgi:hypothetical protein